jgi:hypothetical protein
VSGLFQKNGLCAVRGVFQRLWAIFAGPLVERTALHQGLLVACFQVVEPDLNHCVINGLRKPTFRNDPRSVVCRYHAALNAGVRGEPPALGMQMAPGTGPGA